MIVRAAEVCYNLRKQSYAFPHLFPGRRHPVQFALLVKSHANARYAQSLQKLAAVECDCMLFALNAKADIRYETLAGTPFLMLTCDTLGQAEWAYLARHSSLSLAAERDGDWLRPLRLDRPAPTHDLPGALARHTH